MNKSLQAIAQKNFDIWNKAIQTSDAGKVAELYDKDVTFLPTMSDEFLAGKAGAKKYFTHFLQKHPVGKIIASKVQKIANDQYIHSGLYDFEVDAKSQNQRDIVHARFSFIWKNIDHSWVIIHHHSSLLPKL